MKMVELGLIILLIFTSCGHSEVEQELENEISIPENLDTITLMHVAFACDCQHWVIEEDYNAYYRGERGTGVFDLDQFGYYLEPGKGISEVPYKGRFRFYGNLRSNNDWPTNANFMDDNPPKGKVFTYYRYEDL